MVMVMVIVIVVGVVADGIQLVSYSTRSSRASQAFLAECQNGVWSTSIEIDDTPVARHRWSSTSSTSSTSSSSSTESKTSS